MNTIKLIWMRWMHVNIVFRRASAAAKVGPFQIDLNNLFVGCLCHFATFADIRKDEEP